MSAEGAPVLEARAPRGERNEGRRGPRADREAKPAVVADEAMPAAQAFVDTQPGAAPEASGDSASADATRRRRRRGGRGRGRDEGTNDGVNGAADGAQDDTPAVDAAPIAAESVLSEAPPAAEVQAAAAPEVKAEDWVPVARAPVSAAVSAPMVAAVATAEPEATPEVTPMAALSRPATLVESSAPAPALAPAPAAAPAAPYRLPTDSLAALATGAGLQGVNSDSDKIRAVQEAMANEPKPIHVPRAPKPRAVPDDGPLVLIETKKDLSQVRLPFDA